MTRRPLILQLLHVNKDDAEARALDGGRVYNKILKLTNKVTSKFLYRTSRHKFWIEIAAPYTLANYDKVTKYIENAGLEINACKLAKCELKFSFAS